MFSENAARSQEKVEVILVVQASDTELVILNWCCALLWPNQHAAHPCSINRDKASILCKETCLCEKIHTHLPNMLRIENKKHTSTHKHKMAKQLYIYNIQMIIWRTHYSFRNVHRCQLDSHFCSLPVVDVCQYGTNGYYPDIIPCWYCNHIKDGTIRAN